MERRTFEVDEDFSLPQLRAKRRSPALEAGPARRVRVVATYYDTDDLRLLAAGVVLRRRRGAGGDWLLRVPVGRGQLELRVPSTADQQPPPEVRRMVAGWVGRRPLAGRLTVDTDRTASQLADAEGTPLVELADDRSVAERLIDGHVVHWRSLWLEPLAAEPGLADALADRLIAAGARPATEALPLDLALDRGGPKKRRAGATDDVVGGRLRSLTVAFGEQCLLLRQEDPEAVHDFRVAVRRLRSLLRTFRPLFEPEAASALRAELRWLGDTLGELRDAEVLAERYERMLDAVPAEEQLGPVRAELVGAVRQTRLAAGAGLADALDSDRYGALVDHLHDFAHAPPYRPGRDGGDRKLLRRCVATEVRRTRRLLADAVRAEGADRDGSFHEVRKAAKRVRYAGETMGPVAGKDAARLEKRFKEVQDLLGARNDAVVSRRILLAEGARTGVLPGHNGYTYGLLSERERRAVIDADAAFPAVWERAEDAARRWA